MGQVLGGVARWGRVREQVKSLSGQITACCADDEATIQAGIDTVRNILADHYVHRNRSELVKSTIRERGRHRIIDKVTATLNEKDDVYQAEFANPGIKGVLVEPNTIKAHPSCSSAVSGAYGFVAHRNTSHVTVSDSAFIVGQRVRRNTTNETERGVQRGDHRRHRAIPHGQHHPEPRPRQPRHEQHCLRTRPRTSRDR